MKNKHIAPDAGKHLGPNNSFATIRTSSKYINAVNSRLLFMLLCCKYGNASMAPTHSSLPALPFLQEAV